jgi:flagellar capping protein FliD
MTMALSTGLVSGLDTAGLIDSLIAAESAPKISLKARMSEATKAASAYQTVNTTFLAITSAAEALGKPETWTASKATATAGSVAVSASAGAAHGSLSFTVQGLAAGHSMVSTTRWSSTAAAANLTDIAIKSADGTTTKGTVALTGTESLTQVAAAINKDSAALGVTASIVQTNTNQYALQITATKSGKDATFSLGGAEGFGITTTGADAELKVGTAAAAYSVFSATNTFDGVMAGTTLTVSELESTPVTVTVAADPASVASKVQALVDAVNSAITQVRNYTSNAPGSNAVLKGDFSVSSLAGRLLDAVSYAVGSLQDGGGSPAQVGLTLTKEGRIDFKQEKFTAALTETPGMAQKLFLGTDTPKLEGIADRLLGVGKAASDSTTGTLVSLAKGKESAVKDIQERINAWDLRLEKRREALQRQYTAMETALSSLKSQSTWLSGQINSLPSGA